MYKIKQIPEDFIVKEISNVKVSDKGDFSYILLKKRNYTTLRAIEHIAAKLRINAKRIGFAGNKDKNAVTEQLISIFRVNKDNIENIKLKDIELRYIGKGNKPISLGDLEGNDFVITVRNLNKAEIDEFNKKIKNKVLIPNYFGEQRFSKNNYLIGKSIIKKDFKKAVELVLKNNGDYELNVRKYLKDNKNDLIGALRRINKKLLRLFVHSCQSYLFNEAVNQYLKINKNRINIKIPVVGFGTEIKDIVLKEIINKILKKEKISPRDFIIKSIPELSCAGSERDLFTDIKNLKINEIVKDELNNNRYKAKISFSLPKGSYATVVIATLLS